MLVARALAVYLALLPGRALAHEGAVTPANLWTAWSWLPLMPIGLIGWRYTAGILALWRRAGPDRGVRFWQAGLFATGLLALVLALVSPLDALAGALLSAHMVQHLVLMLVAAPLLVLGAPPVALVWALPQPIRRGIAIGWHRSPLQTIWSTISQPAVVWIAHLTVVWGWHAPGLYQAALAEPIIHGIEHASFFEVSVLFWWIVVRAARPGGIGQGVAVLYLFGAMMTGGVLGALMALARTPWYPTYAETAAWGLMPLEDQQVAGLLMWVPASLIYLPAALTSLGLWIRSADRASSLAPDVHN